MKSIFRFGIVKWNFNCIDNIWWNFIYNRCFSGDWTSHHPFSDSIVFINTKSNTNWRTFVSEKCFLLNDFSFDFKEYCIDNLRLNLTINTTGLVANLNRSIANPSYPLSEAVKNTPMKKKLFFEHKSF